MIMNLISIDLSKAFTSDNIGLSVAGPCIAVNIIAVNTHQAPTKLSPRRIDR